MKFSFGRDASVPCTCRACLCVALLAMVSMLLGGCGVWQTVSDSSKAAYHDVFFKQIKVLNIDLVARASINPDANHQPCSVAVRVYQLKDRKGFDAASYDDLLRKDRIVLAQDLQDTMAAVVNPGAAVSLTQPMQADTKYVAVVAFYQTPDKDGGWKRVIAKKRLSVDAALKLELVGQTIVDPAGQKKKEAEE